MLLSISNEIYYAKILFTASFTAAVSILYFFINSAGVADSPNVSFTATNSCLVGLFLANIPATDSPKPPDSYALQQLQSCYFSTDLG